MSEWPLRRAYLSQEEKPTLFGVHPEIAKYYGVDPAAHESRATTLNYTAQHKKPWRRVGAITLYTE